MSPLFCALFTGNMTVFAKCLTIFFHEKFTLLDDDDHHHNTGHCDDVNHLHIIDILIKGASKESSLDHNDGQFFRAMEWLMVKHFAVTK